MIKLKIVKLNKKVLYNLYLIDKEDESVMIDYNRNKNK